MIRVSASSTAMSLMRPPTTAGPISRHSKYATGARTSWSAPVWVWAVDPMGNASIVAPRHTEARVIFMGRSVWIERRAYRSVDHPTEVGGSTIFLGADHSKMDDAKAPGKGAAASLDDSTYRDVSLEVPCTITNPGP